MEHLREIKDIEIAQLHLRYAHTRIERPEKVLSLAASIERIGQIVPVTVLSTLVLLDGYLRVKALQRLRSDTVMAEIWECKEEEALAEMLARSTSRRWDLLEEAALLAELHDHCGLSQSKIASMVGRTQGWVSSRLALYRILSEDIIEMIKKGSISTWTAMRVIVPIARAQYRSMGRCFRKAFPRRLSPRGRWASFFTTTGRLPGGRGKTWCTNRLCS